MAAITQRTHSVAAPRTGNAILTFLEETAPGLALGVARILIGVLWWQQLGWKMPPGFGCGPGGFATIGQRGATGLCDWIGKEIASPLVPAYRDFLVSFVAPNLAWMGWIIWFTEAFIAVTLILGLCTRLGALVGTLMAINLYIGLVGIPIEWYWTYAMLIILNALFLFTAAGRWLGLDALIRPRVDGLARRNGAAGLLRWLV